MDKFLALAVAGLALAAILGGVNFRYYLYTLIDARRNFKDYRDDHLYDQIRFEYLGYILPYVIGENARDDEQTKDLIHYHNFWARFFWVSMFSAVTLTVFIAYHVKIVA